MEARRAATTAEGSRDAALVRLLAHDLRTPLGPLALAVTSIAEDAGVDAGIREIASFAAVQCARMGRLIDAAVWAVRGAATRPATPVPIRDVATAAADVVRPLGIACRTEGGGDVVPCDPGAVRDALAGLVEAVAGDGGRAALTVVRDGGTVRIDVAGPEVERCAEALRAEPDGWRAAYVLGARAVFRAHGGDVDAADDALVARLVAG